MKDELCQRILDRLYAMRSPLYLANDPLSFCHRYSNSEDQEVVGLIASSFAYGNVKIILRNLDWIFGKMGSSPRSFVENFEPERDAMLFAGFKHRFNGAKDLCALLWACRYILERANSIGEFFYTYYAKALEIAPSLINFTDAILNIAYTPVFGSREIPPDSHFSFLFPSPASGSACKRLCMYLRWMVRPADGIDLGLWPKIHPSKLIIPVDTHIQQICKFLGFTQRKHADWQMAKEITEALRAFDPDDPVKYDFSLCHLGISKACPCKDPTICSECPIAELCKARSVKKD